MQGRVTKRVGRQRDADTQRRQRSRQEQRPQRPVGFTGRRVGLGDVEAGHDAQCRVRRLGNATAGRGEVVGKGVDEVRVRVGRQAAPVHIHLNQIAYISQ